MTKEETKALLDQLQAAKEREIAAALAKYNKEEAESTAAYRQAKSDIADKYNAMLQQLHNAVSATPSPTGDPEHNRNRKGFYNYLAKLASDGLTEYRATLTAKGVTAVIIFQKTEP